MTTVEIDYNQVLRSEEFTTSLSRPVAERLHPGDVVELDGGQDVPLRKGEVLKVEGRRVCFRFVDPLPVGF